MTPEGGPGSELLSKDPVVLEAVVARELTVLEEWPADGSEDA